MQRRCPLLQQMGGLPAQRGGGKPRPPWSQPVQPPWGPPPQWAQPQWNTWVNPDAPPVNYQQPLPPGLALPPTPSTAPRGGGKQY